MLTRDVVRVVVPLANDALVDDENRYCDVGPNFRPRLARALCEAWYYQQFESDTVCLAFGAGTDEPHAHGPTLAACCAAYAERAQANLPMLVNRRARICFGTLPEMQWVRAAAAARYAGREIEFVFVSQPRHLWRVWVIKWLFMPRIRARYVPSGYTKQVPLLREGLGYLRVLMHRCGFGWFAQRLRRRWTLPFDRG